LYLFRPLVFFFIMTSYYPGFQEFLDKTSLCYVSWYKANAQRLPRTSKVLSVGCGFGNHDLVFVEIFSPDNYIGVDPSKDALLVFKERINQAQQQGQIRETSFQFFEQKFEDYVHTQEKVDLVLMIHSLYYIPNREEAIKKALDIGEKVLIIHNALGTGVAKLQKDLIPDRFHSLGHSGDIIQAVERISCNYEILGQLKPTTDVSSPSNELLDFFMEKNNLDAQERQRVLSYMAKECPDGVMTHLEDVICVTRR